LHGARRFSAVREAAPILSLLAILLLAPSGCGTSSGAGGGATSTGSDSETTSTAGAGTSASVSVELTPSQGTGVRGTATLTDAPGGVEVVLDVQNLAKQAGTVYDASIREGDTCANDRAGNGAPLGYQLGPLVTSEGGTASSMTLIGSVSVARLLSGPPRYISVRNQDTARGISGGSVSCADLPSSGGDTTGL
jgi:hypothetical protein